MPDDEGMHVVFQQVEVVGHGLMITPQSHGCRGAGADAPQLHDKIEDSDPLARRIMLFSKEYVGYLARQATNRLIKAEMIETADVNATAGRVGQFMLEDLSLEDRINEEVRTILEAYQDEAQQYGASYQEAFKKIKNELVKKYKAVL
jgi:hypothetical protein